MGIRHHEPAERRTRLQTLAASSSIGVLVGLVAGCTASPAVPVRDERASTHVDAPSQPTPAVASESGPAAVAPCTSRSMSATLEPAPDAGATGQVTFTLRYNNIGDSPCVTAGYPGATLVGPDFPGQGAEFELARSPIRQTETLVVDEGKSVIADLTVLTTPPGSADSWQPVELHTIAPDDTAVLSVSWPPNVPVLRQDGATHPGSYIGALHRDG